jgi:hypothetical protein
MTPLELAAWLLIIAVWLVAVWRLLGWLGKGNDS